jgi:hypothetical protein
MRSWAFHEGKQGAIMSRQQMPGTLELVRGNAVLGTIEVNPGERDFPWYSGAFHPSADFEPVRGLFERELELLQANTSDDAAQWDDWEAVHAELHEPGLRLQAPDRSYEADEILIHIDGAEAWWRSGQGMDD